jgi:hypothetical protein
MKRVLIPSVVAVLGLAACSGDGAAVAAPPQSGERTQLAPGTETAVMAPDRSMRLVSKGDGEVLISAGFFNRTVLARIELPSQAQWAPDSRRLFINAPTDGFHLFEIGSNGADAENPAVRQAAVAELGRFSGCTRVPELDAMTTGMAWAAEGWQVYVRVEARGETGDCRWGAVRDILVVADVETGRLLEVTPGPEARLRFPELPWDPL